MDVTIKGKTYRSKEQPEKKMSHGMAKILMMATMFGGMSGYGGKSEPERPKVDIVKEYELILDKKSKLSKSQRDWVEWQFNKNFIEVTQTTE